MSESMTGRDESSNRFTSAEIAAFEATDDLRERARIIAAAQRRVLTQERTDQVANSWQRLIDRLEESGKTVTILQRLIAHFRRQSGAPSTGEPIPTVSALERTVLASVIGGTALQDPWRRDLHLEVFDSWLLPELELRQLNLHELEEVAARLPHGLSAVLAPQANSLCPQLWRWLRDAQRRRLIRPASGEVEPSTSTRWDLTEVGERLVRSWTRPVTGQLFRAVSSGVSGTKEVAGLVIGLLVATGLIAPGTREAVLNIAALGLFVGAGVLLVVGVEDLWVQRRRRRDPRGPVYQRDGEVRALSVALGIFQEAVLQQALVVDPDLPRVAMEPPPDFMTDHPSRGSTTDPASGHGDQ